jgi:hypothetical protein
VDSRCREARVPVKVEEDKVVKRKYSERFLKYFQVGGIHGQGNSDDQSAGKNSADPRDEMK